MPFCIIIPYKINFVQKGICKSLSRRSFIVGGFSAIATLGICWRFYDLQILKGSYYLKLSDNNRTRLLSTTASRGLILDRDGIEIATNRKLYNIFCNPREIKDRKLALQILREILKLTTSEIEDFNRLFDLKKTFLMKSTFNWGDVSLLEFKSNYLSGIYVNQEYKRFYPFGSMLSHIVGYTGNCGDSYCGKLGLEALYDERLKNKPGIIKREVNSRGTVIKEFNTKEATNGENITVSISTRLQSHVSNIIRGKKGTVSIIEVKTGRVLAIVNSPSYDSNIFSSSIGVDDWNRLNQDKSIPLVNRALSFTFQPGSTFKPISALAALENGIIDANTKIKCNGYIQIGNRRFHCWKKSGHGDINVVDAISQSCNVFFYKLALQLKIDELAEMARKFGLGSRSFAVMKEESPGVIPTKAWREKMLGGKWNLGDTVNTLIGHGYLLCTPFQLALVAARISTGKNVTPNFDSSGDFDDIDVSNESLKIVRYAMLNSFDGNLGVLRRLSSLSNGIAGKTGTAQVLNTENLHLTDHKEHSLFIGYKPYDKPKYCISAVLENAGSGRHAAKLAIESLSFL